MRTTLLATLLLSSVTLLVACKKAGDPAYLKGFDDMAAETCACLGKPNAGDCGFKALGKEPKTPGGEPSGVYEEGLTEADQAKIKAARAKAQGCMDIIKKSGGGG